MLQHLEVTQFLPKDGLLPDRITGTYRGHAFEAHWSWYDGKWIVRGCPSKYKSPVSRALTQIPRAVLRTRNARSMAESTQA